MSVLKSQRNIAHNIYLREANNLRVKLIRFIRKCPKSYMWTINANILNLSAELSNWCSKANTILNKIETPQEDLQLKRKYLLEAKATLLALTSELNILYQLLEEGNNFIESKEKLIKIFSAFIETTEMIEESLNHNL